MRLGWHSAGRTCFWPESRFFRFLFFFACYLCCYCRRPAVVSQYVTCRRVEQLPDRAVQLSVGLSVRCPLSAVRLPFSQAMQAAVCLCNRCGDCQCYIYSDGVDYFSNLSAHICICKGMTASQPVASVCVLLLLHKTLQLIKKKKESETMPKIKAQHWLPIRVQINCNATPCG